MVDFRVKQHEWEVNIPEKVLKDGKKPLADLHRWQKQDNKKDNNGEYSAFYFADMAVPDGRLVLPLPWNLSRDGPLNAWVPERRAALSCAITKVDKAIRDPQRTRSKTAKQGLDRFSSASETKYRRAGLRVIYRQGQEQSQRKTDLQRQR